MIRRTLEDTVARSLKAYPIVGILGSRQVGKTTLAKMIQNKARPGTVYLDLELPSDWNKLQDPELYLGQFEKQLVIIDEIQRMPALFPLLRALVDQNRVPGRFLILGSASPALIRHSSESLAGRIIYHELSPFGLYEIGPDQFQKLFLRGGYPGSFLAETDEAAFIWLQSFIRTYLETDVPQLGVHIPAAQLRRFWTMLAHSHGQLWNASRIAGSLGVTAPTVRRYLDILEDTFIVRQLQPFHANLNKRLIKSPKIYLRDSGILHALLGARTMDLLQGHPALGSAWEGFVIEQIISLLPEHSGRYFYRTSAGAEIDFLFFDKKNNPVAVEVKYSMSPTPVRGFWNAYEDLSCKRGFVVYPGKERYPIAKNVFALPVTDLRRIIEG